MKNNHIVDQIDMDAILREGGFSGGLSPAAKSLTKRAMLRSIDEYQKLSASTTEESAASVEGEKDAAYYKDKYLFECKQREELETAYNEELSSLKAEIGEYRKEMTEVEAFLDLGSYFGYSESIREALDKYPQSPASSGSELPVKTGEVPETFRDIVRRECPKFGGAAQSAVWKDGVYWAYRKLVSEPKTDPWISVADVKKRPKHSEPVLAVADGKLMVLAYCFIEAGEDSGWAWCNCYGNINGDPEFDDVYNPTLWTPIPAPPSPTDK